MLVFEKLQWIPEQPARPQTMLIKPSFTSSASAPMSLLKIEENAPAFIASLSTPMITADIMYLRCLEGQGIVPFSHVVTHANV